MQKQPLLAYQKAIEHLQYLPPKQQMIVFDVIESFFETADNQQLSSTIYEQKINERVWQKWLNDNQAFIEKWGFDIHDELCERQKSFLIWRANYEKKLASHDDWTDDEHDNYWASLKDKSDTGREVSFE